MQARISMPGFGGHVEALIVLPERLGGFVTECEATGSIDLQSALPTPEGKRIRIDVDLDRNMPLTNENLETLLKACKEFIIRFR